MDWLSGLNFDTVLPLVMHNAERHFVRLQPMSYRAILLRLTWSLVRPRHISEVFFKDNEYGGILTEWAYYSTAY